MADPLAPFIHQLFRATLTFLIPAAILAMLVGVLRDIFEKWAIKKLRPKSERLSPQQQDLLLDAPPGCPRCRKPMVRRMAKKGLKAESAFWGCSAFPRCRGTREMA